MFLVLPLIFTLQVNAQVVSSEAAKAEVLKKPRFSASVGFGLNYGFGEKGAGRLNYYKSKSIPISLKLGYLPIKYLEVQGEYSGDSSFKAHTHSAVVEDHQTTFNFTTLTINLKVGVPVVIKRMEFYPYVVLGTGKAKVDYWDKLSWPSSNLSVLFTDNSYGSCFKSGIGTEVKFGKRFFAFSELNNWTINWERFSNKKKWSYSQIILGLGTRF